MVINPGISQAIITNRLGKMRDSCYVSIGDKSIALTRSVTLLGLQTDNRLNFYLQFSTFYKKVVAKLNALSRFSSFSIIFTKKAFMQSFVYSQRNYGTCEGSNAF